ncbi:MAG: hypothetical protein KF752_15735 [Pirellulaceae bacterium]|nr:hypothetical protein [Pirellulaceae bacterium]
MGASSSKELLATLSEQPCDRIIVACENRWHYPRQVLEELLAVFPEVPVALAMSDWWLGSRRTGARHLSELGHLCLPWFRWWDAWTSWLDGNYPWMFGPFPSEFSRSELLSGQKRRATEIANEPHTQTSGLIVAGTAQAAQAWRLSMADAGRVECYFSSLKLEHSLKEVPHQQPAWVLWDDSRLSTVIDWRLAIDSAAAELKLLRKPFPTARLWVAWTQPTWDAVQRLNPSELGFELLAKPNYRTFSSAALART